MSDERRIDLEDIRAALLAKIRSDQCNGEAALAIADWLRASIEGEPRADEGEREPGV